MRRNLAIIAAATLPFTMVAACSDDDDDIETPDLDPGEGTGVPGEGSISDVDLDPGDGTGLPGDEEDE